MQALRMQGRMAMDGRLFRGAMAEEGRRFLTQGVEDGSHAPPPQQAG